MIAWQWVTHPDLSHKCFSLAILNLECSSIYWDLYFQISYYGPSTGYQTICGSHMPAATLYDSNMVVIEFKTDFSVQARGFHLTYEIFLTEPSGREMMALSSVSSKLLNIVHCSVSFFRFTGLNWSHKSLPLPTHNQFGVTYLWSWGGPLLGGWYLCTSQLHPHTEAQITSQWEDTGQVSVLYSNDAHSRRELPHLSCQWHLCSARMGSGQVFQRVRVDITPSGPAVIAFNVHLLDIELDVIPSMAFALQKVELTRGPCFEPGPCLNLCLISYSHFQSMDCTMWCVQYLIHVSYTTEQAVANINCSFGDINQCGYQDISEGMEKWLRLNPCLSGT